MHILFAEDQAMERFFLSSHLRAMGHTVTETANGQEALEALIANSSSREEEISMLITDWDMPVMSGIELAIKAREIRDNRYLYIILLTGKGDSYDRVKGFAEGGVDDYVVKPFEIDEVKLRIQVGLRLMQAERSLRDYSNGLERIVQQQTQVIRNTQSEIISRLFNALQSRHAETGSHVRRIGVMSAYLARVLGWATREIDLIQGAAPLHDVGKIGISDDILLKPGALTATERLAIQKHTTIGGKILSGSTSALIQMAERIAVSHHENWDGSGYPSGISGENIPIEARIVSVVDVYDALRSDRVYRKGFDEDTVLTMLREDRGIKFDPWIFDIFINHVDSIRELLKAPDLIDEDASVSSI